MAVSDYLQDAADAYHQRYVRDTQHPVTRELALNFVALTRSLLALSSLVASLRRSGRKIADGDLQHCRTLNTALRDGVVTLHEWLQPPQEANRDEYADWLMGTGLPPAKARELAKQSMRQGRPPTERQATIQIQEARELENLSWDALVSRFCPCKKSEHDEGCLDRIKKNAKGLRSLREKYRREVPRLSTDVEALIDQYNQPPDQK